MDRTNRSAPLRRSLLGPRFSVWSRGQSVTVSASGVMGHAMGQSDPITSHAAVTRAGTMAAVPSRHEAGRSGGCGEARRTRCVPRARWVMLRGRLKNPGRVPQPRWRRLAHRRHAGCREVEHAPTIGGSRGIDLRGASRFRREDRAGATRRAFRWTDGVPGPSRGGVWRAASPPRCGWAFRRRTTPVGRARGRSMSPAGRGDVSGFFLGWTIERIRR